MSLPTHLVLPGVAAVVVPAQAGDDIRERAAELTELLSPGTLFLVAALFVATYYVNKLVDFVLERLALRLTRHRPRLLQLAAVSRMFLWIVAGYLAVMGIIQPPRDVLIAVAATVGVGVGLASQDVLKNLFGGIVILLDRPFQVGDLVDIGPNHGEVKGIGLRATQVLTRDDTLVAVPNAEIVNRAVLNANSGALDCMVVAELYLPSFSDPAEVRRIVYEVAVSSPYVYWKKPITLQFEDTISGNRFATRVLVRAYVYDHRLEIRLKTDIVERATQELLRAGIVTEDDLPGLRRLQTPAPERNGEGSS